MFPCGNARRIFISSSFCITLSHAAIALSAVLEGFVDRISKSQRSANMAAIKSKGMKPEMTVRKICHSMGYRFRLHRKDLPGNPDLVFPGRRKIIFVHGCFWHQHSDPECPLAHRPRSNMEYWGPKLERTQMRDARNVAELESLGWRVLVLWECETKSAESLTSALKAFLQ